MTSWSKVDVAHSIYYSVTLELRRTLDTSLHFVIGHLAKFHVGTLKLAVMYPLSLELHSNDVLFIPSTYKCTDIVVTFQHDDQRLCHLGNGLPLHNINVFFMQIV